MPAIAPLHANISAVSTLSSPSAEERKPNWKTRTVEVLVSATSTLAAAAGTTIVALLGGPILATAGLALTTLFSLGVLFHAALKNENEPKAEEKKQESLKMQARTVSVIPPASPKAVPSTKGAAQPQIEKTPAQSIGEQAKENILTSAKDFVEKNPYATALGTLLTLILGYKAYNYYSSAATAAQAIRLGLPAPTLKLPAPNTCAVSQSYLRLPPVVRLLAPPTDKKAANTPFTTSVANNTSSPLQKNWADEANKNALLEKFKRSKEELNKNSYIDLAKLRKNSSALQTTSTSTNPSPVPTPQPVKPTSSHTADPDTCPIQGCPDDPQQDAGLIPDVCISDSLWKRIVNGFRKLPTAIVSTIIPNPQPGKTYKSVQEWEIESMRTEKQRIRNMRSHRR